MDLIREAGAALVGGMIGWLIGAMTLLGRLSRLEQWAWGPMRSNGIDGEVKDLRREFTAHLRQASRHDAALEKRNHRQHPNDIDREEDRL